MAPPKGKSSPLAMRTAIIRQITWLHDNYHNFNIADDNAYQQALAAKA